MAGRRSSVSGRRPDNIYTRNEAIRVMVCNGGTSEVVVVRGGGIINARNEVTEPPCTPVTGGGDDRGDSTGPGGESTGSGGVPAGGDGVSRVEGP